jgi:hypothetical protein
VKEAKEAIANGCCVVIGLQTTGEVGIIWNRLEKSLEQKASENVRLASGRLFVQSSSRSLKRQKVCVAVFSHWTAPVHILFSNPENLKCNVLSLQIKPIPVYPVIAADLVIDSFRIFINFFISNRKHVRYLIKRESLPNFLWA